MTGGEEIITSVLPALEPLFGAAFAINLAYLNLKHFRYRESLISEARKLLDADGGIGINNDVFSGCVWYDQISSLIDQGDEKPTNLSLPLSVWSVLYRFFFHPKKIKGVNFKIDRIGACLCTFFSALYLIFGVAHSVGRFEWSIRYFTPQEIGNELFYAIAFLIWPIILVCAGAWSVLGGLKFINYQLKGIKTDGENQAQALPPPLPEID